MEFTIKTYNAALRRADKRIVQAFADHQRGVRGPEEWVRQGVIREKIVKRWHRHQPNPWARFLHI